MAVKTVVLFSFDLTLYLMDVKYMRDSQNMYCKNMYCTEVTNVKKERANLGECMVYNMHS